MTGPNGKIRILHMIKNLGLGGAETNLLNLMRSFSEDRFEHHAAYSVGGPIEERFRRAKMTLFRYAESDHRIKSPATIPIVARIAAYLWRERIDIVHTHNFNGHCWGSMAAKIAGKKILEHVHDYRYLEAAEYRRRHGNVDQFRFIRLFRGWSDRVVVLTQQNQDFLLEHGYYPAEKIRQIRNGIPMEEALPDRRRVRQSLGFSTDEPLVLTAARLAEEKNIELVVDVAAELARRGVKAMFIVAGDGPLSATLKRRAAEKGAANVRFIGYHADIRSLLAACDVFLLPSFLELHSIAILEALSARVPAVVSSDVGCNSQMFSDGVNGFLCDPFHPDGWVGPLSRLLSDEALRRRVGDEGYRLCRDEYDVRRTAEAFMKLYEEMVS